MEDKFILAITASIRANAKNCEEYARISNELQNLQELLDEKKDNLEVPIVKRADEIIAILDSYDFYNLPKVKELSFVNRNKLVELLIKNEIPFVIAMLDFLGFIQHLLDNYFHVKYELYKEMSKWFKSDKEGRTIKGNINILSKPIEYKSRYTANQHKRKVQELYNQLK